MEKLEKESPKKPIHISGSVGEGGDNNTADVIGVEIHLNLFILSGNLKGVKKSLFTFGLMTEEFISAIRAFQKHVVGLSDPDGRVDPNGKTLKYLNGPLSARGGTVDPGKIAPPPSVTEARLKIAATALKYLGDGGHFLMGAMGDMPGKANGHPLRPAFTLPATFMDKAHKEKLGPAVNAAWASTGRFGVLGCMGRPVKRIIPDHLVPSGSPRTKAVESYAECIGRMKAAGISNLRWPGFNLYERRPADFDKARTHSELLALCPDDGSKGHFPRRTSPNGEMHLGESCVERRHYDCIGFVNFVLCQVLSSKWAQEMSFYMKSSTKFDVTTLGPPGGGDVRALAQEGDLVFKNPEDKHCGVCTVYQDRIVVTNCRSMSTGLVNSELKNEWRFLARLINV